MDAQDVEYSPGVLFFTEKFSSAELAKSIVESQIVNITYGFPARDKQQLAEIISILNNKGVVSMPIIGVYALDKDGRRIFDQKTNDPLVKTYIFCNSIDSKEYSDFWEKLGGFGNVAFSTMLGFVKSSDEGVVSNEAHLILPDIDMSLLKEPGLSGLETVCLPLAEGATKDLSPHFPGLTQNGRIIMKKIFSAVDGVVTSNL